MEYNVIALHRIRQQSGGGVGFGPPETLSGVNEIAWYFTEYDARNRGEDFGRLEYAEEEELKLSPLPCWAHLTPEQYRQSVAEPLEPSGTKFHHSKE